MNIEVNLVYMITSPKGGWEGGEEQRAASICSVCLDSAAIDCSCIQQAHSTNHFVYKKLPPTLIAVIENRLVELTSFFNQATSFLSAHEWGGGNVMREHVNQIVRQDTSFVVSETQSILNNVSGIRQSWDEKGVCPFGTTNHCPSRDVSGLLVEALNLERRLMRFTYPPGALPSHCRGGGTPPILSPQLLEQCWL